MKLLFGLSVLPALLLMMYIRSKDKIEKEPPRLLVKLFMFGALTTISAAIIEVIGEYALDSFLSSDTLPYALISNFLIIALAEEGGKLFVLKKITWRSPEFDYTFDAVVYSVAVSLGFATLENVLYVFMNGTVGIAVMRGILAVPGHAIDGIYMGYFYGLAKRGEAQGDEGQKSRSLMLALIVPVLIHGFYDFCLTWNGEMLIVFIVFEILITILALRKVNQLSREDMQIYPGGHTFTRMYSENPGAYGQNYTGYTDPFRGTGFGQFGQYGSYQQPFRQPYQQQNPYNYYGQNSAFGSGANRYVPPQYGQPNASPNNRSPYYDRYGRTGSASYGNNEYYRQEQKQKNFWEE